MEPRDEAMKKLLRGNLNPLIGTIVVAFELELDGLEQRPFQSSDAENNRWFPAWVRWILAKEVNDGWTD